MSAFILTLHAVLAGVWLGGVVFTTAVVSPALNTVKWGEGGVRAEIGRRYARVKSLGVDAWERSLDVNVRGFIYCFAAASPAQDMRERGGGRVM